MKEHIFNVVAFILSASLLLLNKQVGEGFRQWNIEIYGKANNVWAFRIPIIIVSCLMIAASIASW